MTFQTRTAIVAAIITVSATPGISQEAPLSAVATVGMVGDVVTNVGGECVAVSVMMGPGIDPHLYQATARDVQNLNDADVIFYSGQGLEGQLGDVLARFAERIPTLAVAEAIARERLVETDDSYGVDPHLWMDAGLWAEIVPGIAEQISTLRPDCAENVRARAEDYVAALQELDSWAKETIATIPEAQRVLVTAHDAFEYFSRAYAIEVEAIQGISTQSEAGIADIRETANLLFEKKIPAIFVETTINPRTVEAVIEAAARQGHEVVVGGALYSDALGDSGTPEGTYIGMIAANVATITEALGGTVLARPDTISTRLNE